MTDRSNRMNDIFRVNLKIAQPELYSVYLLEKGDRHEERSRIEYHNDITVDIHHDNPGTSFQR